MNPNGFMPTSPLSYIRVLMWGRADRKGLTGQEMGYKANPHSFIIKLLSSWPEQNFIWKPALHSRAMTKCLVRIWQQRSALTTSQDLQKHWLWKLRKQPTLTSSLAYNSLAKEKNQKKMRWASPPTPPGHTRVAYGHRARRARTQGDAHPERPTEAMTSPCWPSSMAGASFY